MIVCGYTCMYLCLAWRSKIYLGVSYRSSLHSSFDLRLCDVSVCVGACGGQSLVLGVLLNCFSPHVLRHVNPVLTYSVWLLDQDSRWDTTPTQNYMGSGDLNLVLTLEWQ